MKSLVQFAVGVLVIGLMLALLFWWPVYKYHDCRRVGHSRLYCIMDFGK